jgi:predicted RNase H-like HicB family nuclease
MVLDLIVHKTDDGYTAEVPGLKGCESWAHTEDNAIDNVLDMAVFYLKLESKKELKIDRARTGKNKIVYKLVFHKAR